MKKTLILLAVMGIMVSCEKNKPEPIMAITEEKKSNHEAVSNDNITVNNNRKPDWVRDFVSVEKPRVRIRHGIDCRYILGVCLIIPFRESGILPHEYNEIRSGVREEWGTANMEIINGKLWIAFDQQTALVDGTLPISKNIVIQNAFGYNTVIVKQGVYNVDFTNNQYGEVLVDIQVQ